MSCGVVPSRHIVLACLSEDFVPGYHRFALYCLPGRLSSTKYYCPRIARMDTKAMRYGYGDRVGRTNCHECNEGFIYMSCGVVPSRHIGLTMPHRALRTRLPSLRSVVPSRHPFSPNLLLPTNFTNSTIAYNNTLWILS